MIRKTIAEVVMSKPPDNYARISLIDGLAIKIGKKSKRKHTRDERKNIAEQKLLKNPNSKITKSYKPKKYKRSYA
jgi:hypothetical protein